MDTHGAHGCHNPAQGKAHTSETRRHARPHGGGGGGGFCFVVHRYTRVVIGSVKCKVQV